MAPFKNRVISSIRVPTKLIENTTSKTNDEDYQSVVTFLQEYDENCLMLIIFSFLNCIFKYFFLFRSAQSLHEKLRIKQKKFKDTPSQVLFFYFYYSEKSTNIRSLV